MDREKLQQYKQNLIQLKEQLITSYKKTMEQEGQGESSPAPANASAKGFGYVSYVTPNHNGINTQNQYADTKAWLCSLTSSEESTADSWTMQSAQESILNGMNHRIENGEVKTYSDEQSYSAYDSETYENGRSR